MEHLRAPVRGFGLSRYLAAPALLLLPVFSASGDEGDVLELKRIDPPEQTATLFVHTYPEEEGIAVEARLGEQETCFQVPSPPAMLLENLVGITTGQETCEYSEFEAALEGYSTRFFGPMKELVEEATEVEFVLSGEELLSFPFDLLQVGGESLFLHKPVAYSFEEIGSHELEFEELGKGLLVSDVTADPERAVEGVREMLPEVAYFDIAEADPRTFHTLGPIDLLLVSAHGDVHPQRTDSMRCGESRLSPENLEQLKPKLVYFDSCSLGVSLDFMEVFMETGVEYYLAPFLSNEAGNSSTKTMLLFFEALRVYDDPVHALFLTRRQLHEHFGAEETGLQLLFRSFLFRAYRLSPVA